MIKKQSNIDLIKLKNKIYDLNKKLDSALDKDNTSKRTILRLSQNIDKLIIKYYKLK